MLILALDPGERTGWAASDGTCGTLDLSAEWKADWAIAGHAFIAWLTPLLAVTRLLVVERPFGRPGTTDTANSLALLAHMEAQRRGVRRQERAVSTVRKIVLGRGNAPKRAVRPAVEALGYVPTNDHEADACALLEATLRLAVIDHGPLRAAVPVEPLRRA